MGEDEYIGHGGSQKQDKQRQRQSVTQVIMSLFGLYDWGNFPEHHHVLHKKEKRDTNGPGWVLKDVVGCRGMGNRNTRGNETRDTNHLIGTPCFAHVIKGKTS